METNDFVEFAERVRLDPNTSEVLRRFIHLKYLRCQSSSVIAEEMGLTVSEVTTLETEFLRKCRSEEGLQ